MVHGVEKHHEIKRTRIFRDTRPFFEQILEDFSSFHAILIVYVILVFPLFFLPALFELSLVLGLIYSFIPLSRKPDIPFRKRKSLNELDRNDKHPGTGKPQQSRGIAFIGNRKSDNAEIWAANEDLRTHAFIIGSTGAGKTEGLISIAYNALVWGSGFAYTDGKGDVSLYAKIFSMVRSMGREDDLLVINYMTGNADTTKKRSDKLSNTYNPFAVGNSESLIQLVVSLMDAGDAKGDMWKGRAISFMSSVMPALVDLRDQSLLMLHIGAIREALPYPKYFELMNNVNISQKSRDMMQAFLYDVPGYKRDKGENQSATFNEQYGYQQMQFTRILSSLADTYGHIYHTPQGEVVLKDVVVNRRIFLALLPALEKSRPELGNLGKIIVAGMKGMMGAQLGNKVEGSKLELLDSRQTTAPTPFIAIFDELGYYIPDDAALMWAQARSLGFALIAAGQDLQAFYRTSKEETLAIVSNSNIKIFGKLEDPTDTFDLAVKLAGEAYVSVVDGYEMADDGAGSYRGNTGARIERVSRVELQDFKEQVEGEIHFMVKSDIIRARMFYADFSGKRLSKEYQLNHFVKVIPPNEAELKAFSINTQELRETLRSLPLAKQRPTDGYFGYVAEVEAGERYKQYLTAKLGVERGICLLLGYDDSAVAPVVDQDDGSAGGAVGNGSALAQAPTSDSDAMPSLAQAPGGADQPALAAAPVVAAGDDAGIVFDGGQLASINIFAEVPREPFGIDIVALASAAIPIIETALEGRVQRPAEETPPAGQGGLLDEQATRVSLNSIALGLGAPATEAGAMVENIIQAATQGSEYPVPPKPEKAGKDQEMEDVMSNLESLIGGRA
ncbi:IcmO-like type IV secretion system protein [Pseudomonas aeruginosa]|uniref:IcmO-like type IV secretion system protein n=1 Tax=Pseudomonas aeruginosa TaxID=287 RepID=UPI0022B8E2E4|nr:IcmO-like type IV secretion system protein [Pseudomonas aeruginosa]MCZ7871128.1 IcmO-like type IV secretion system protein [Pseudomonas aeruginosa]